MTCDGTPHYSLQDSNQLLSREIELQNGIEVLALNYANVSHRPYRLFIEEKNNNSVIQIALAFGYKAVTETVTLFCNPGGAIEYFSTRPCTIRVKALTVDASIIAGIEGDPCVITNRVYSSASQNITNAAYSPVGDFTGFCPPYCDSLSIYPNGNIDVRITDQGQAPAVEIFEKLNLDESSEFLRDLKIGNRYKVEVKSVNPNGILGSVWFNNS
tara:strand:+ start:213 stop:854 length:642 start_codon:yes stop_codon:yes gene_type:complete